MGGICKVKEEDLNYAIDKINYWYKKNIKYLTIVTVPFNTACVFCNIIDHVSSNRQKILYVWGKNIENRELVTALRNKNSTISHSYIRKGSSSSDLTFINYNNIEFIEGEYELIIFDDITYFSSLSQVMIREIIDICSQKGNRTIIYSIVKNTFIGEKIELVAYNYKQPFVEPRVITTRINLDTDIPYTLYDYLKWFKDSNRKVAIYVPSKEKLDLVYEYFTNRLKLKEVKIIKASKKEEIKKYQRVSMIKDKAIFIITNKVEELLEYCYMDDAVVLFSDDSKYDYKKLLYMCGQMRSINSSLPEILFVSNEVSEDMEKVKKMARNFNKKVWEKKLKELQYMIKKITEQIELGIYLKQHQIHYQRQYILKKIIVLYVIKKKQKNINVYQ
eukprot:TRINITY_DN49266_c0_g1_i1.p1 TRINITY_DN49266_c0_g1~~TRINITY_DN49266_c0_g1_i1.p1  ORF type:complete len:389 (-),score=53.85 TRINITY_DN49266_c0_g1_i1:409-1575(-)